MMVQAWASLPDMLNGENSCPMSIWAALAAFLARSSIRKVADLLNFKTYCAFYSGAPVSIKWMAEYESH